MLPIRVRDVIIAMNEPTIHELARQIAVLEERMKTHQAEYTSAIDRLRADMAVRDAEYSKRENRIILTILGGIGLATTILGLLIAAN